MVPMTPQQEQEFEAFLREKASEAQSLGYKPTQFLRMLNADGGFKTVSTLLSKPNPSLGYENLWELHRLDLTVEALVVETKWRGFFHPEQIGIAERRLRESDYEFSPYVDLTDSSKAAATARFRISSRAPRKRTNSLRISAIVDGRFSLIVDGVSG